jgi:hypothetical protein
MINERALKAKNWKATCIVCGKTFTFENGFECQSQPGRHVIENKEYYHLGAGHIQSLRDRRMFTPTLNLCSDIEVRDKVTGQISRIEGVLVHFREGGKYETSDPQEQYYLDMHPGVMTGQEGRDAWDRMYLTPEQQTAKARGELADVQKQIRESNALLSQVKAQKGADKDAAAVR